uniref:Putative calcineurin-like phosphoesterase n=1 Tax=viral metagenome TaxID=1070528 RepID=A0A6M3JPU6_9ZZZZ
MAPSITHKGIIVKEAIRRFNHLPSQTIARHVLATHGDLWENNLEIIRTSVRKYRGSQGKRSRTKTADKSLYLTGNEKIEMPATWRQKRTSYKLPPGTWLVMSDVHVPFHEKAPIEAAIQAGQAEKVDGVFLNGDIMDCAAVSYWPTVRRDFNAEVEATIDFLDFLRGEFPKQKIVYKPGNHEYRLPRYFLSKAPDLIGTPLAAMETVMGFERRGIDFLDYFQIVYAGKLPILHGHEVRMIARTVNPARGLFLRNKMFSLCGHCHTTSEHTSKTLEGTLMTCWSVGCLCDLNPDYNPYGNDWNWGFAVINVEKNGHFEVVNKRVLPNGKVV